jgi:hypothetical protein
MADIKAATGVAATGVMSSGLSTGIGIVIGGSTTSITSGGSPIESVQAVIQLSYAPTTNTVVNLSFTPTTASPPSPALVATNATVTIPAGQTTATVPITFNTQNAGIETASYILNATIGAGTPAASGAVSVTVSTTTNTVGVVANTATTPAASKTS